MEKLLKDLDTLIAELSAHKNFNELERDLLKEKIRRAYEALMQVPEKDNVTDTTTSQEPPPHGQPEEILASVDTISAGNTEKEEVPEAAPVSEKRAEQFTMSAKIKEPATLFDITPEADRPQQGSSVHERISDNAKDISLAAKLNKNPVEDLKKSIGINEKFSFINDLFDGDLQAYNSTIDQLNSCNNFDQANEILISTAEELSWEKDSETLGKLTDLVERRFNS
jgi:hypothetical protein